MKLFYISKNETLGDRIKDIIDHDVEVIHLNEEEELLIHDFEKCILLLDIDTLKDHGFSVASRLATLKERKSLIVGVTSLDVDSTGSKFDYFFNSLEEVAEKFNEILEKYEEI